ncbi:MAG: response regulator [Oscillospiraceae bacterium]
MYDILLVEDDSAMRFLYSKMKVWSECGFRIAAEVSNGKDALEVLGRESFDLVVTDIRMPFVDGIELLREIKKRGIDVCVIFVSSYDEFEYARQGLVLGAFDYILKPVNDKKLSEVLERTKQCIAEKAAVPGISRSVSEALHHIGKTEDENSFIRQISEYFSENTSNIITMDEAAEHFNFNKDYFGKLFKQNMGVTFSYFSSVVKVEYAKELLATGNYKTYQISEKLGYSSPDYFTRIFKEITGRTPSQYKSGSGQPDN